MRQEEQQHTTQLSPSALHVVAQDKTRHTATGTHEYFAWQTVMDDTQGTVSSENVQMTLLGYLDPSVNRERQAIYREASLLLNPELTEETLKEQIHW